MCSQNFFVVGFDNGKIVFYSYDKLTPFKELKGHKGLVSCIVIQKDLVISAGFDQVIRVWNEKGSQIKLTGHNTKIFSLITISNKIFASAHKNKIFSWKIPEFEKIQCLDEGVKIINFQIFKDTLAVFTENDTISLWSLRNNTKLRDISYKSSILAYCFSLENSKLLTCHPLEIVKWDLEMYTHLAFSIEFYPSSVYTKAEFIFLGDNNGTVYIRDFFDPNLVIATFSSQLTQITNLLLCKNTLFYTSLKKNIETYNLKTENSISLIGHTSIVQCIQNSGNEKYFLSAADNNLMIWSVKYLSCFRSISLKGRIQQISILRNTFFISCDKVINILDQKT